MRPSKDPNIIYSKFEPQPMAPADKRVEVPAEYLEFEIIAYAHGIEATFGHMQRTKTARNYFMIVEEVAQHYTLSVLYIGEDYVPLVEEIADKLAEQKPFHTINTSDIHDLLIAMIINRAPNFLLPT